MSRRHRTIRRCILSALLLVTLLCVGSFQRVRALEATTRLQGHIPLLAKRSRTQGRVDAGEQIRLAIALPLRNQAQLDVLLARLYTPRDPLFHQYLTPEQFAANFGPAQADYDAVIAYAKRQGLTIADVHPNRALVDVTGSARQIEKVFGLHLMRYQAPDNRVFRAP